MMAWRASWRACMHHLALNRNINPRELLHQTTTYHNYGGYNGLKHPVRGECFNSFQEMATEERCEEGAWDDISDDVDRRSVISEARYVFTIQVRC